MSATSWAAPKAAARFSWLLVFYAVLVAAAISYLCIG